MAEWFYLLLGAVVVGYFALAGYDYGVGMLLRATAKTDEERRMALGALGPFFLGNEVWLVAALGLLLGAFPLADGALLSGLYPILVPLIAVLMVFTGIVQVRSRAGASRPVWDMVIVVTGAGISFGWGAVFGATLQGFPIHFGPLPMLTGLLTTALFVLHGATLLTLRAPEAVRQRAHRIATAMVFPAMVSAAAAGLTAVATGDAVRRPLVVALLTAVLIVTIWLAGRLHRARRPGWALLLTGTAAALPVIITGTAMLPYLYVDADASRSLTVTQAAASGASLDLLAATTLPLLPLLLAFQVATWWIWRRAPRRPIFY
jgi:cytochrome d ubiquinol oxidase subunit II